MFTVSNITYRILKGLFVLIAAVASMNFSYAQKVEPMSILFIGNSYTHMNNMPGIFEKIAVKAGKNVHVEKNTRSGASFKVHCERADMYEAIRSRKWDYVILQGYSREFTHSPQHIDTATMPYLVKITDSIYANNPCTNILLYMTWGYDNGFSENPAVDTYAKMADSIARGYQYVSDIFNLPIVPVGKVWRQVRDKGLINLYAQDLAHPNINGSYLIATTFYEAIFNESTERIYTSTVKSDYAQIIKKEANMYLSKWRNQYRLNDNRFELKPYITANGEYTLEVKSAFSCAESVQWDFGDGKTSSKFNATHKYTKAGGYKVVLTVVDECGTRRYERWIHYEKPEKPSDKNPKKPKYNISNTKKV